MQFQYELQVFTQISISGEQFLLSHLRSYFFFVLVSIIFEFQ